MGAKPDLKDLASEVTSALNENDYAKAFIALQTLSTRSELTAAQQLTVTRSRLTLNAIMQAAANQGARQAGEVVKSYRSNR